MKISFILPSRNNLKYLKWAYDAIRKNQGDHVAEICVADDASTDGTSQWCQQVLNEGDKDFKYIRNEGPNRLGHTILYDKLVNEVASYDVCIIWHADMYLCPGSLDSIEKLIKPKTIVSLTRIEPPLHPPGPEKITRDFGTEPEQFNEEEFLEDLKKHPLYIKNKVTEGVFAPWAFYKSDFQEIGGHDWLFAPQSKEDSDIFNRFQLNGVKFIQTWEGFVYHMTCRGSRFNPTITQVGKNSDEWETQNMISTRNFLRKWGCFVKHDQYMKPIIPPKYKVHITVNNAQKLGALCPRIISILEPRCNTLTVNATDECAAAIAIYIEQEQQLTKFNLASKFVDNDPQDGISLTIDAVKITTRDYELLELLPQIIEQQGAVGITAQLENFKVQIHDLTTYHDTLIKVNNEKS